MGNLRMVFCQSNARAFGVRLIIARDNIVSVERFAGSTRLTGLNDSQMMSATPCLAASKKSSL